MELTEAAMEIGQRVRIVDHGFAKELNGETGTVEGVGPDGWIDARLDRRPAVIHVLHVDEVAAWN